ncbi:PH domain-containing protein, partial [Sphingorhabdus sp.]
DFLLPFDLWDLRHWIGMAEERGVVLETISWNARIAGALFALAALILIGVASGVIRTFLTDYGFRLDRTAKGFRRQRGLLTRTDIVMPVSRVQAAVISTGLVRKWRGWHALQFVSLAQESKQESHHMVAPLARLDEIWPIIAETGITPPGDAAAMQSGRFRWWLNGFAVVLPIVFAAMAAVMILADTSLARASLFLLIPMAMLLIGAFEWRLYRHGEDGSQLYQRRGWWRQKLTILPQLRVQSVEIAQGPLARASGLAALRFGVAGGKLEMIAMPLSTAREIRDRVLAVAAPVDFSEINQRG